jgi:hypothetical protein
MCLLICQELNLRMDSTGICAHSISKLGLIPGLILYHKLAFVGITFFTLLLYSALQYALMSNGLSLLTE